MLIDSTFVTSRQVLPYATNKPLSLSRYGVSLMEVSVSAITNMVAYDMLGRPISRTDGRGNTIQTEYNSIGHVSATIDALGNRSSYVYDLFSNLITVTNAIGNVIAYEYDLRAHKVLEYGATYPVCYTYDIFGNRTTMITFRNGSFQDVPALGDTTTWFYDIASSCITNKIYANSKRTSYNFTPDGKLAKRTLARGIVTEYSYDNWGNLTNTVYSDDTPTVSFSYDALGRQTEAHDAAGVTTFLYDSFGSLTSETVVGVAGTNTIVRYWDDFGRSVGYALNGARQTTIAYEPDKGRISTMETPSAHSPTSTQNSNCFTWNYLPGSDLKSSLAYPNGLTASWLYDANNQLLQVCNANPTNTISQYDYTYDAIGRRVTCAKSGSAFIQDDTVAYGYNNRSELTNAVAKVDSSYRYAYDFDDIGNREASSERGANSVYTANNLNQYTAVDDFTPQFDDDGNQTLVKTATGIWQVRYNGENRPIHWSNGSKNIIMSFDRMGRRVTKNNQRFIYDGYLCIGKIEDSTSIHYSLSPIHCFVWDPTEPVATRPLVWNRNGALLFYTHDGNKNVGEAVSMNADVVAHYEYAPFGAVSALSGTSAALNPWRFSSEYAEDDTMTVYYNYRHYEPMTGRWLARDLLEELATASFMARTCSASQRAMIAQNSSELCIQIRASNLFRKALGLNKHNGIVSVGNNAIALYLHAQNDPIDAYDELGAVAQWVLGCGGGACWGGIGGFVGGISRGWRSGLCGAATGALTGCAQGAACASGIPQLCLYGSCIAGFLGSVANDICTSGRSFADSCSWFAAIINSGMGCVTSNFADVEGLKEKLIIFVLGGDVSSWSSVCGGLQ